jgi:hypothetical protein
MYSKHRHCRFLPYSIVFVAHESPYT